MLIGYARVSTADQNLELQRDALQQAGCERVFEDHMSGTRASRPGLEEALSFLRAGDTLVCWRLDRVGRSLKHLVEFVGNLAKTIQLRDEPLMFDAQLLTKLGWKARAFTTWDLPAQSP